MPGSFGKALGAGQVLWDLEALACWARPLPEGGQVVVMTTCGSHLLSVFRKQKAPGSVAGTSCCGLAGRPEPQYRISSALGSGGGCNGTHWLRRPSRRPKLPWFLTLLSWVSFSLLSEALHSALSCLAGVTAPFAHGIFISELLMGGVNLPKPWPSS